MHPWPGTHAHQSSDLNRLTPFYTLHLSVAFENIPGHLLHGLRLCRSRLSHLRRKLHQQVFFHMTLKFFKCTFSRIWFPMPAFPNNTESLVIIIMVMIELKRPKINRSAGKFLKLWLMAGLLWEFLMLSKTLCAWGGVWVWRSRMCQRPRLPPRLWNLDHYPQHLDISCLCIHDFQP